MPLCRGDLDDVGRFDERLFDVLRDLDLSWRGSHRGWRYRSVPSSVVRHVHAASSIDGSRFKRFYDVRNHLVVLSTHTSTVRTVHAAAKYLLVTAVVRPSRRGGTLARRSETRSAPSPPCDSRPSPASCRCCRRPLHAAGTQIGSVTGARLQPTDRGSLWRSLARSPITHTPRRVLGGQQRPADGLSRGWTSNAPLEPVIDASPSAVAAAVSILPRSHCRCSSRRSTRSSTCGRR